MIKKHIICYGDSNTHGYDASTGGRFDEEHRFTCLLQEKLGGEYLVIEEGLSGRTTCFCDPVHEGLNGLDYITPCLMSHEPVDLLIIFLGTNDTKERFNASAACIAMGLKRLIMKAAATECWRSKPNTLIIVPQNIDKRYECTSALAAMGHGCAEKSAALSAEFKSIAAMCHCSLFDANTLQNGCNTIDFMHLSGEGHCELAQSLSVIIPTL